MERNALNPEVQFIRHWPNHQDGLSIPLQTLALVAAVATLCFAGCSAIPGMAPLGNSSTCGTSSQAASHVEPGYTGLYAAVGDGISRYQVQQSHLTLIWYTRTNNGVSF